MPPNDGNNVHRFADYQQKSFNQEHADSLKSGGPGGTSGGMDGWQTSVESRLGSIQTDVRDLRAGVGSLNTTAATLTERVAHLPSKSFIIKASLTSLAVIAALVAFQGQIQALLKISH